MRISEAVIVVLEAANGPMTLSELAEECQPYVAQFVSYFDVKQVCLKLFVEKRVSLEETEPLTFAWSATTHQ